MEGFGEESEIGKIAFELEDLKKGFRKEEGRRSDRKKKRIFIWGVVFRGERKAGSPAIAAKTARNLKSIGFGGEAQRRGDFQHALRTKWNQKREAIFASSEKF